MKSSQLLLLLILMALTPVACSRKDGAQNTEQKPFGKNAIVTRQTLKTVWVKLQDFPDSVGNCIKSSLVDHWSDPHMILHEDPAIVRNSVPGDVCEFELFPTDEVSVTDNIGQLHIRWYEAPTKDQLPEFSIERYEHRDGKWIRTGNMGRFPIARFNNSGKDICKRISRIAVIACYK
ncbi:MAG: hypothetical protein GC181_11610 [Bacteroidetes bacterium]|nr:hypothetical protein [Bacteroidota bacterium]